MITTNNIYSFKKLNILDFKFYKIIIKHKIIFKTIK